jgi:hypothetical protein
MPMSEAILPAFLRALDVGGRQRELQPVRVLRDHAVHDVDLLEHRRDGRSRIGAGRRRRHVHGPELAADTAGGQPREVGHDRRLRFAHVERVQIHSPLLPHLPRVIVVAVDDGDLAQQASRAVEHRIGLRRQRRGDRRGQRQE